eukprot:scaffold1154_cov310-Pinguiococcus_pyrenoidosus.AAC.52
MLDIDSPPTAPPGSSARPAPSPAAGWGRCRGSPGFAGSQPRESARAGTAHPDADPVAPRPGP